MKIGIGIDTGGTCTDAVVYRFEDKKIMATAKTPTTHGELWVGIGNVIDQLPVDLLGKAEVIALSTTLATNACVEGKGGRAKLFFFGVTKENIQRVAGDYGLTVDDSIIFVDCKTRPSGEIVEEPDWKWFEDNVHEWLDDTDAVGIVEMYANKSGAVHEKKAAEIIERKIGIPVVCGYSLFSENNIVKRGATALLNARLIFVINTFLNAVKRALDERNIKAPFVIVRSDGSLMTGKFTATRPVETLLCGPVASVMGATELTDEHNSVIVDIGGTTTDVAFVKGGSPMRAENGIRIGNWNTFVQGLFVDTFGLGGDSGVIVSEGQTVNGVPMDEGKLIVEDSKVMPLCMAAVYYPSITKLLQREYDSRSYINSSQKNIYVRLRDISQNDYYTDKEKYLANLFTEPASLEMVKAATGETVLEHHIERLIFEGVLIRCGVTPTDAMHFKGEFTQYDIEASKLGISTMARICRVEPDALADMIYDAFKRKLYCNLSRILIEDAYPDIREKGLNDQMMKIIDRTYDMATSCKSDEETRFLELTMKTDAVLVGVGAPTGTFLPDVAKLLGTRAVMSEYSAVANALGAVVGKVSANAKMEVRYMQDSDTYVVSGNGERIVCETLDEAKKLANTIARDKATQEAILRGAEEGDLEFDLKEKENIIETEFGSLYMGYKVVITASGKLRLN